MKIVNEIESVEHIIEIDKLPTKNKSILAQYKRTTHKHTHL